MIKDFENFLNEAVIAPKQWHHNIAYDLLDPVEVEAMKKKMNLKPGDPVLFTGNRWVCELKPSKNVGMEEVIGYTFDKGEDLNTKGYTFVDWATAEEIKSLGKLSTMYHHNNVFSLRDGDTKEVIAQKIDSFLMAKCKDSNGNQKYLSLHNYNPKYKKAAPKAPDLMDRHQLEAVVAWVAKDLGIEEAKVFEPRNYDGADSSLEVSFTTWFVYTRPHAGDDAKVAGPFGKRADAEKETERLDSVISREGDLDQDKLGKLRFRVDAKNPPLKFYAHPHKTFMPNKEFTSSVKKLYGDDILTKLRGTISGKKFGI
jgi:hypothetical protein